MPVPEVHELNTLLKEVLQKPYTEYKYSNLSGGCINTVYHASSKDGDFVLKLNLPDKENMFEAEALGLQSMYKTGAVKVPEVLGFGSSSSFSYIILEYIDSSDNQSDFWENFGRQLALMHQASDKNYGFPEDNYIGSLRQRNTPCEDWVDFFIRYRLSPQLKLTFDNGKLGKSDVNKFEKLYIKLPDLLVKDKPALLHGDLWSGNVITGKDGYVVLIDPAVYYGHREAELAFTKLFGGFRGGFYESYFEVNPVENGFSERRDIYNLYPLLVHVNLFGGSYINSVRTIINRFV